LAKGWEIKNLSSPSPSSQPSRPVLRAVIDVQDFNIVLFYAINRIIAHLLEFLPKWDIQNSPTQE
jgi:hypothetical protein